MTCCFHCCWLFVTPIIIYIRLLFGDLFVLKSNYVNVDLFPFRQYKCSISFEMSQTKACCVKIAHVHAHIFGHGIWISYLVRSMSDPKWSVSSVNLEKLSYHFLYGTCVLSSKLFSQQKFFSKEQRRFKLNSTAFQCIIVYSLCRMCSKKFCLITQFYR